MEAAKKGRIAILGKEGKEAMLSVSWRFEMFEQNLEFFYALGHIISFDWIK